jgi:malonate-semialdehyde dehydrogenase (acetylating) / methylmalonate-semialdehyde dehydrogenase
VSQAAIETRVLGNYINGDWRPAATGEQLDVTNPATGELLARVPLSGAADVDAAVAAARAALPAWRSRSTIERARWLFGFRQVL